MDEVEKYGFFSTSDLEKSAEILQLFKNFGLILGTAESLTGGLLSAAFTSIPGASHAFTGGLTVYQTYQKHDILGVPEDLLQQYGPASEQCAYAMAKGTLNTFSCDEAISTTGVAGPDKDEWGRAVGTVFVSCAFGSECKVKELHLDSALTRHEIRMLTVKESLSFSLSFFQSCVGPLS